MPGTFVDPRGAQAALATKGNILPQTDYGNPQALLGENADYYAAGIDASTGASAVVTADTSIPGGAAPIGDSGQLAAGEYAYYIEVLHPSAAAANRQVLVQVRDAANAQTQRTIATVNAGAGTQKLQGRLQLDTNERVRLLTGSDATNTLIAFVLLLKKLD
jgi:hypothetical protein